MLASTRKVLVLNSNWSAIGVVDMPSAIGLLYTAYSDGEPRARIVTPPPKGNYEVWDWSDWSALRPEEGENGLVSASNIYKVPEVILLSRYGSLPEQKVNFCRRSIWKRDDYTCQYCGVRPKEDECTLDHVIPKSLVLALLGLGFFARYFYLDHKVRKEKSFLVVGLGILAFWFFGGTGLLTIAVVLALLVFLRGC